jgi:hypothetical protein
LVRSPLGHPSCLSSSFLICLASHILIFKNSFIREPKVPLANSRTAALITTRMRTRVTYERRWEKKHGDENTQVEKMARKNIEGN